MEERYTHSWWVRNPHPRGTGSSLRGWPGMLRKLIGLDELYARQYEDPVWATLCEI